MKLPLVILLAAIACGATMIAGTVVVRAINQNKVTRQAEELQARQEQQKAAARQDADGGSTPAETLRLFSTAVAAGDSEAAARLCVPALRDHVAAMVAGADQEERHRVAAQIDRAAQTITEGDGMSVTVSAPVFVELIKYPSEVWKLAAL